MIYDLIIIGAGAAGLFSGASLPHPVNGLILEKKAAPGRKLLMSGSGQCNLTHGGSIKDFITRYGNNGALIRPILYQYNNLSVIDFFERKGLPLFQREDDKIFPKSLKAQDVLDLLIKCCMANGLRFLYSSPANRITINRDSCGEGDSKAAPVSYTVYSDGRSYETKKLIIATGGCSYPATGSDGTFFSVLSELGIEIIPPAPALVPVYVKDYPYENLSGISFQHAEVTIQPGKVSVSNEAVGSKSYQGRDALLLTHTCFSGPAVLNLSRHARVGNTISVNYFPFKPEETLIKELSQAISGNKKQFLTVLYEYFHDSCTSYQCRTGAPSELPKRFLETICIRSGADAAGKASSTSIAQVKSLVRLIVHDRFEIIRLGGFESAMVTAGGTALSEISTKTMESLKYPNLYFAGEVLDVDGDTGGYNLQFAFSSGRLAARNAID